jgi:RNA polymerase sigma-70 factor, ECF subfamily
MALAFPEPRRRLPTASPGRTGSPVRPSASPTWATDEATHAPRMMPVCSDAELIQRTGAGDRTAFEKLYKRYARPVFGLALRRLGDRGRAEDALQETFVSIWRSAATYKPERGPGAPWLYGVARNAIVDRSRARTEPPAETPDEPSLDAGPDERAEGSWVQWRVHRALETLPEREREVIALAYWSDLSQSEVAERLGIPLGTVKTRTRAALAHLAETLEGELE